MKTKANNINERVCTKCKTLKILDITNFHSGKGRQYGFSYICRPCESERGKIKYLKNPRLGRYKLLTVDDKKKRLVMASAYRKTIKGRAIFILKAYQRIDKKKKRICNLTQDYLINNIFNKPCVYCGFNENRNGCDRLDNNLGHTVENVAPCCPECNLARSNNFTHDEMKIIGKAIREIKEKRKIIYQ